jgi:hypothetical protein
MKTTVATLDSAGIRTILLADTPLPGFDVLSCLARSTWNPVLHRDRCEFRRTSATGQIAHRIDAEVAAGASFADLVDLTDAICATEPCRPEVDGIVRYRDAHHLSTRFAVSVAGGLAERILPQQDGH